MLADRPFGQWNQFRIVQIGSRTTVWLNDQLVVDNAIMEDYWDADRRTPLRPRGPIHLQTHGGEIRWRNLFVRAIPADEANRRLRGDDAAQGFQPIFNGSDLAGWTGAVDNYEVRDGAIACKPGEGGVMFTEQQYDDFVVRLEFLLPPGGNNGPAIRYPGTGRASYDAMTELQVLDDAAEKYATLDARQFHGSAYGMVPAHRGYLRPAGQWNYEEVTIRGPTIVVELNGTVILDADLSQVTEFLHDWPHPGKDLTAGHFGFAGHADPVMFLRPFRQAAEVTVGARVASGLRSTRGRLLAFSPSRRSWPSCQQDPLPARAASVTSCLTGFTGSTGEGGASRNWLWRKIAVWSAWSSNQQSVF